MKNHYNLHLIYARTVPCLSVTYWVNDRLCSADTLSSHIAESIFGTALFFQAVLIAGIEGRKNVAQQLVEYVV